MNPARYSVVRFVPDLARNEALNIGILLWDATHVELALDDDALARVVRENPHLAKDALQGLSDRLIADLAAVASESTPEIGARRWLASQRGYPVAFTEDRQATIDDSPGGFEAALARLVGRVVTPRRRYGGGGFDMQRALERSLRPLLNSNRIERHHALSARSGVHRSVDYFANAGANVGLDLIKLNISGADEIRKRADAEAFKVEDILATNAIEMLVLCSMGSDPDLAPINAEAETVLRSVGATVVTEADAAVRLVRAAVDDEPGSAV